MLDRAVEGMRGVRERFEARRAAVQSEYEEKLRDLQKSRIDGEEFIRLRRRIEELRPLKGRQSALARTEADEEERRRNLLAEWEDVKAGEFRALERAGKRVTRRLEGRVRVRVEFAGNRESLFQLLRDEVGECENRPGVHGLRRCPAGEGADPGVARGRRGRVRATTPQVPSIADLDRRRLEDYFTQIRQQDTPASTPSDQWRRETAAWARDQDQEHWRSLVDYKEQEWRAEREADWVSLLVNTEVLDDGDRQPATVAGLLLFGSNPSRYLPQAKIDAAAYLGTEKDYDAGERCTLRGPIVRLQDAGGAILEPGLVERAVAFVRRNIDTVRLEDGVRRQARWDYPEDAVREAVVNAIVHRDYLLSGTDIELSIYLDRLEVVSPGRLPNGITPARMRSGCRSARNELLKDVMRDYGYPEHMGMGIPRKIMRSMRDHNGTDPELVETDEGFLLRLWKNPRA